MTENQWINKSSTDMVREFHFTYGLPVLSEPAIPSKKRFLLRLELIEEELDEFVDAAVEGDLVGVADALGDLLYVVIGAALEYGIPLDDVVEEIHRSNMSKLMPDGSVKYREDGKVLKGPDYSPPDIGAILNGKNGKTARTHL